MKKLLLNDYMMKLEETAKKENVCVNTKLIEISDDYERTKNIKDFSAE